MRLHSIRPHRSIHHWLLAFLVGFATLFSAVEQTTPASAAAGTNTLYANERLQPGEKLISADGRYHLVMQGDGNLVLYANGTAIWSTRTNGKSGASLVMQGDGNLVLYHNGVAVWATGTNPNSGVRLVMQTDGNLVLYTPDNRVLWSSGTAGIKGTTLYTHERLQPGQSLVSNGRQYRLLMQRDGNLVIYANSAAIWATGTNGKSGASLVMQGDGNLVLYHNGVAVWATGTNPNSGVRLVMQTDGNLVLYTPDNRALWSSKSSTSSRLAKVVSIAHSIKNGNAQPGWGGGLVPYSWGGGHGSKPGPSTGTCYGYTGSIQPCPATKTVGVDCSGLTRWVYALAFGSDVLGSGNTNNQITRLRRTSTPQPGDLVFYGSSTSSTHHVGIYIGNGQMINALRTGTVVKIDSVTVMSDRLGYFHYGP